MHQVVEGVHQVSRGVNAFIVDGDDGVVLVDTGLPRQHGRIIDGLASIGRSLEDVRAILITHAHVDHVGGAAALAEGSGADVYASELDAPAIEGRKPKSPPPFLDRAAFLKPLFRLAPSGAPVAVNRHVEDDATVLPPDLTAIPTPGHTVGHTSFLLDRADGVLFVGDAALGGSDGSVGRGWMNMATPRFDASISAIAELDFAVACFGHSGPITHDAASAFRRLAESL